MIKTTIKEVNQNEFIENKEKPELYSFAFCGTFEAMNDKLKKLAELAEPEVWCYNGREDDPYHILRFYIVDTFSRCKKEDILLMSEDGNYCTFNTGLLTKNSQDILALLIKNDKPDSQPWKLLKFVSCESLDYMTHFSSVAKLPKYWEKYDELYYNPDLDLQLNMDHILDDNWDRISSILGINFNKTIVKQMLLGAVNETKVKIKRNMRLVVPQYYREKIMFLVPISFQIEENKSVTLAMAVEKMNERQYRANTIFTLEMAYSKARQLMRPEANWLISK